MTRQEVSDMWFAANQNIYLYTENILARRDEPYGYLWFTKHMEYRFTHHRPTEGYVGEIKPVYEQK